MIYAILSDIHGNLTALEAALADARAQGAEALVCLGDLVGYGPQPQEVVDCARNVFSSVVMGNHDAVVAGTQEGESFIDLAGDAAIRHRGMLTRESLAWLRQLPYRAQIEGADLAHGAWVDADTFPYIDSIETAGENFAQMTGNLLFVGHTHIPALFVVGASRRVHALDPQDFVVEEGKRYIVNPGSVGYPRRGDGACYSSYILYNSREKTVQFRYLPFAMEGLLERGRGAKSRRKLIVGLALTCMLLALGGAFWVHTAHENVKEAQEKVEELSVPFAQRELLLQNAPKFVSAGLELAKDSGEVLMSVRFEDAKGVVLPTGQVEKRVKKSAKGRITIPQGAKKAIFSLYKRGEKTSKIQRFAPEAI